MLGWPSGNVTLIDQAVFQSAPGEVKTMNLQRPINLLVVSVKQGGVDIWLGNYGTGVPSAPHLHFGQTNTPVWIPIPETLTDLTIKSFGPANPVLATVLVGGRRDVR